MTSICLPRLTKGCAALGVALALGLAMAPQAARAGDDNTDSTFYKATFGRLMEGLGLKSADDDDDGINYRERAPLVIPPSANLPPPEKANAEVNPAWPKDPDVTRRKKLEAERKKFRNVDEERRHEENPLRPEELAPGPRPRGVTHREANGPDDLGRVMSPSELGYKGGMFGTMFKGKNDDVAKFTGEPPRATLTDPPAGYQTPSPDQPYGVGQAAAPKADDNYTKRGELIR